MLPFWLSELTDCGVDNSMVVKGSRKECVLRRSVVIRVRGAMP